MTDAVANTVLGSAVTEAAKSDWNAFWASAWGIVLLQVIQVAVIILIAFAVRAIAHRVVGLFVDRIVTGVKRRQRAEDTQALLASPVTAARVVARTRTLGSVLNNVVTAVVVIVAVLSIITVINPNITGAFSLITAALGAGLGFGAQNIVKDVLTGLFMVADDQLGVGDVVNTDLATGIVENVGIRVTQIRDVNGVLWYVRNGEITRVGNLSQGWSRAIVDVTVPKDVDIEAVQHRMLTTATEVLSDPQWAPYIADKPELWGLESVTPDGVVLRLVARTRVNTRDDVAWSLRVHLREALASAGVQPTSITSTQIQGFEAAGALRGVRPLRTGPVAPQRRATRARTTTRVAEGGSHAAAPEQAAPLQQAAPPQQTAPLQQALPTDQPPPMVRPRSGARGTTGDSGASGRTGPGAPSSGSDGR